MNQYQKWILTGLFASSVSLLCADQPSAKPMTSGAKPAQSNDKKPMSQNDITPPAGPLVDAGARFVMTADFIYWQMKQDSMDYSNNILDGGVDINQTGTAADVINTFTSNGKVSKLNFDYRPGFKVGAGIISDHDNWDLMTQYTWLRQHARGNNSVSHTDVVPAFSALNGTTFVSENKSRGEWKSHFNNIDLELGRSFFISRRLVLRPHIGLKGAWINQKFNISSGTQGVSIDPRLVNAIDFIALPTSLIGVSDTENKQSQRFWGVGLRAGLNTSWHFTRDWSIYGNIAASELSCRFKNKVTVKQTANFPSPANDVEAVTNVYNMSETKSFHIMRPVLEMALGLRYEVMFSDDNYQFFMQAGDRKSVV